MKRKDNQKFVLSKHENGDSTMKIFRDLNGLVSLHIIQRWCKMISQHGSIHLSHPHSLTRVVCVTEMIQKVKTRSKQKKDVSREKLTGEFDISTTNFE